MKRTPYLIASASLLLAPSFEASAGSADLLVNGSITPAAACDVSIGSTALNLGKIDRGTLNPDSAKPTDLAEREVRTSVVCPQARRFAFVVAEARGSDAEQPLAFNMHNVASEAKAGHLFLLFDTQSTKIDGKQGYATGSSPGIGDLEHATWGPATSSRENLPIPNGLYAVGFVKTADSTDAPVPMETLSVDLLVRPRIKPVNDLDLSGDIAFSSDIGLEIRYF
jgi:hypothetical protein